jgi:Sap, sulfolipid-1-addressing protein
VSAVLLLSLAGLALVDSTSIGTLFIPVWLLLAPERIGARRFLGYLGTIAGFYFAVGVLLLLFGAGVASTLGSAQAAKPLLIAQLVVGVALFALSFWVESRKEQATRAVVRWRDRAVGGAAGARGLTALALLAALAEVATMLPYLGAIGLLATAEVSFAATVAVLAAYCVVMVVPALALFAVRVAGAAWIGRVLERMSAWMLAKGGGMLSWVLGIAGFLVARDAVVRLWFPQLMGGA